MTIEELLFKYGVVEKKSYEKEVGIYLESEMINTLLNELRLTDEFSYDYFEAVNIIILPINKINGKVSIVEKINLDNFNKNDLNPIIYLYEISYIRGIVEIKLADASFKINNNVI